MVKGKSFAEKYKVPFYENYHELLLVPEVDVIIIATPHYLHKQMTLDALAADKHVLCEKPMALTVAEAKEINQAMEKSDKFYATCYQNRFNPTFIKLHQLLKKQTFGLLN